MSSHNDNNNNNEENRGGSKDTTAVSSIAQKLMEKMGWKCGSGLGKNNQGVKDLHSLWRYRRNKECKTGFKTREEYVEPLPHQNAFEDLLDTLTPQISDDGPPDRPVPTSNGIGKSYYRQRRHYHCRKIARVASYSVKDLQGIIGKQITKKSHKYLKVCVNDNTNRFMFKRISADNEQNGVLAERITLGEEKDQSQVSEEMKLSFDNTKNKRVLEEQSEQCFGFEKQKKKIKPQYTACENGLSFEEPEGQSQVCQESEVSFKSNAKIHPCEEQNEQSSESRKQRKRKKHEYTACVNSFSSKESECQPHVCQESKILYENSCNINVQKEQIESHFGTIKKNKKRVCSSALCVTSHVTLEDVNNEGMDEMTEGSKAKIKNTRKNSEKKKKLKTKITNTTNMGERTRLEDACEKKKNMSLEFDVMSNDVSESSKFNSSEMGENTNACSNIYEQLVGHINESQTKNNKSNTSQTGHGNDFHAYYNQQEELKKYVDDHPELLAQVANGFVGSNLMDIEGYGN